jgi:hypothetical protein
MATFKKMTMVSSERLKQLMQSQSGSGLGAPVIPPPEPFQDQNQHSLARIRAEMDKVDNDPSLSPDQRVALMQEHRARFDGLAATINPPKDPDAAAATTPKEDHPTPPPPVGLDLKVATPVKAPDQSIAATSTLLPKIDPSEDEDKPVVAEQSITDRYSSITEHVNSNLDHAEANKMKKILKKIKGRGDIIKFNQKGELVFKKQVIEGSNFSDLFKCLYVPDHKPKSPTGLAALMSGLAELDVKPKDVSASQASQLLTKAVSGVSPVASHTRKPKSKSKASPSTPPKHVGFGISRFPPGKRHRILELYSV